jgi:hypothetical protein
MDVVADGALISQNIPPLYECPVMEFYDTDGAFAAYQ